jgi:hypothetical protein
LVLKTLLYDLNMLLIIGEALGIAQHHDAITGTEKQEVAFDYAMRLSDGIDSAVVS